MEPVQVVYCGVCTLPVEYCEFTPTHDKCKKWHQENGITEDDIATSLDNLSISNKGEATSDAAEPKAQSDVKLLPGGKIKKKEVPKVYVARTQRNKRKFVTTVTGLESFGVKLADASKLFAKKFSCGASVVKNPSLVEEIDIQGDVQDDLIDFILEKWPQIDESSVKIVEETKKSSR